MPRSANDDDIVLAVVTGGGGADGWSQINLKWVEGGRMEGNMGDIGMVKNGVWF